MSIENQKTNRTSLGLILSTLLHGSVIALVAVGPAFLPNSYTRHDVQELANTPISVEIEAPAQAAIAQQVPAVVEPQAPVAIVEPVKPAVAEAPIVIAPLPAPVKEKKIAKVKPMALPQKKIVAVDFNEKSPQENTLPAETPKPILATEVPAQEPVAVAEDAQETVEMPEEQALATAEPITEETKPVSEETTPVVATVEEKVAPTPEATPAPMTEPTATAVAEAPAQPAMASATTTPTPAAPPVAAPAEQIMVTQTYLGLKQVPGNKPPTYSREMRLNKEQGRGQLVYFVSKEGEISQLRLTRSTGSPALDRAAVDAFSQYKFVPGQEGFTVHDFEFSLKGPEMIDAGRLRTSMNQ